MCRDQSEKAVVVNNIHKMVGFDRLACWNNDVMARRSELGSCFSYFTFFDLLTGKGSLRTAVY